MSSRITPNAAIQTTVTRCLQLVDTWLRYRSLGMKYSIVPKNIMIYCLVQELNREMTSLRLPIFALIHYAAPLCMTYQALSWHGRLTIHVGVVDKRKAYITSGTDKNSKIKNCTFSKQDQVDMIKSKYNKIYVFENI